MGERMKRAIRQPWWWMVAIVRGLCLWRMVIRDGGRLGTDWGVWSFIRAEHDVLAGNLIDLKDVIAELDEEFGAGEPTQD